jgi:hypothetical protein
MSGRSDHESGEPHDADSGDSGGGSDDVDEIHFHFPIDIRVVGGDDDALADRVVDRVFAELLRELERRA